MPRPTRQYVCLGLLLVCAAFNQAGNTAQAVRLILHPGDIPVMPFPLVDATRTIGAGPLSGAQILAIDGRPFNSYLQYAAIVEKSHPGDRIQLTLSLPSGEAIERAVVIPGAEGRYGSALTAALVVCLDILIPWVALLLGFGVAFIRPRDKTAWLLLLLLISFTETIRPDVWQGLGADTTLAWHMLWQLSWPIWMLLFVISFPSRATLDVRMPWLKYLLVIPGAGIAFLRCCILLVWNHDMNAAVSLGPLFTKVSFADRVIGIAAISCFFAVLGFKSGTDRSLDARRRLRILWLGASLSLTPVFGLGRYALLRGRAVFDGVPWPLVVTALLFMGLFPLTLAYVIVVERAMDLRFVIRQSVQYGLARVGLRLARAGLAIAAIYLFLSISANKENTYVRQAGLAAVGVGMLAIRKRTADRAAGWIDRKFFREAYHAEHVLSDLATEAGRYIELGPLLEKVAQRIAGTLHVPDIVVLIREGARFVPRYSTRPGEPMSIAVDSRIAQALRERGQALEVYFDKPPEWIRSLNAEELQTLDFMRSQLLLPLFGQGQLGGLMSLGPKRSELPYTATDIRLLQAVASQMALAIENSRLAASLATEAADRERANRELEIAREVQERLFPQHFPTVAGLDCAGYCRPARGVGGDYYDFLQLEDGRLCLAVGDVSGKGIAAALLMASLQASLRGQTLAGLHDLSALMHNVNKLVYEASTSNRYATFFYGEYDPGTHKLDFVNAGHNPPVILRGAGVLRLEAGGPVVGLLPAARFEHAEMLLEPGDVLISFTDGISEALNEWDEEWEEERFIAAAQACRGLSAKHMIEAIFRGADSFTGAAKQYDDMTLLVMKLAG
ncbi:MAG: GAF domain-containing SpoIIE family protein phosphatase [Acidobacteriota bacterium]